MSNERQELRLKDMKVGESVIGYVAKLFKVEKSLTPEVENLSLITKDGKEITIWSSGSLRYFRERMEKAGVSEGVLTKITRTERPASASAKSKQQYYCDILFNAKDVKDPSTLTTSNGSGNNGLAEF